MATTWLHTRQSVVANTMGAVYDSLPLIDDLEITTGREISTHMTVRFAMCDEMRDFLETLKCSRMKKELL